jgi:hypothetical protein
MDGIYIIPITRSLIQEYCTDTINFSDIESAVLVFEMNQHNINLYDQPSISIYAIGQDVLTFHNGMVTDSFKHQNSRQIASK